MDILACSISEKSNTGVDMPLYKPGTKDVLTHKDKGDKVPREMYLTLLGPDSPQVMRALAQARNRAQRDNGNHSPSDEKIEADRVSDSKLLASLTVGGLVFMGGKWVDVDSSNAFEIYYQVKPFRGQALQFVLDEGNFIQG